MALQPFLERIARAAWNEGRPVAGQSAEEGAEVAQVAIRRWLAGQLAAVLAEASVPEL